MGVGTLIYSTAHALASPLCALLGRHKGAWRGAPRSSLTGVQGRAISVSPPSDLGAGGRGWLLVFGGRRGCGRGNRSPTPQRTVLQAGVARCGSGTRSSLGVCSCLCGGGLQLGTLPSPNARPWGRRPGTAANFPWALGVRAWEPVTHPKAHAVASWLCALWGRHKGARGKGRLRPPYGLSGVGHPPSPSCPSLGQAAAVRCPFSVGNGGSGREDPSSTQPRTLLCLAFGAVGWHKGAWRGAPGASVRKVWGRALSLAESSVLWAGGKGAAARFPWARGVWAWGPVTNPTAHALVSWLCALGGGMRALGGGSLVPA